MFLSLGFWVSLGLLSDLSEGEMEFRRQDYEIESVRLNFKLNEIEFYELDFSSKIELLVS